MTNLVLVGVGVLSKLGDDGVDVENAEGLDDGASQRFRGGRRVSVSLQRGDEIGYGSATVA
jgi:hypothetical protein